ncbi:MAG: hypothetical protein JWM59_28 [Verrucomicrobiales bacterium]|nr:hypothetical protein [Verrucomicrobiales bacterium]
MASIELVKKEDSGTILEILLSGDVKGTHFSVVSVLLTITRSVRYQCHGTAREIPMELLEGPDGNGVYRFRDPATWTIPAQTLEWEMDLAAGAPGHFQLGSLEFQGPDLAARARIWACLRFAPLDDYSDERPFFEITGFAWFLISQDGTDMEHLLRAGFILLSPDTLVPKFRFRLPKLGLSLPFDLDLSNLLPSFHFPLAWPDFNFQLPKLPFKIRAQGFQANFTGAGATGTAAFSATSLTILDAGTGTELGTVTAPGLSVALDHRRLSITAAGAASTDIPDHVLQFGTGAHQVLALAWTGARLKNDYTSPDLTSTLSIRQLSLASAVAGGELVQANGVVIVFKNGKLQPDDCQLALDFRALGERVELKLEQILDRVARKLKQEVRELGIRWQQSDASRLLRQIGDQIQDTGERLVTAGQEVAQAVQEKVAISTVWHDGRPAQLRFDWQRAQNPQQPTVRHFKLPGVTLELPVESCSGFSYSLIVDGLDKGDPQVLFLQTICPGQTAKLYPSFALGGDGGPEGGSGRYLGEEDGKDEKKEPFLTLTATPRTSPRSVVYFGQYLNGSGPRRRFLKELNPSLPDQVAAGALGIDIENIANFSAAEWALDAKFSDRFMLPFLKAKEELQNAGGAIGQALAQYVEVGNFQTSIEIPAIRCSADLRVILGRMRAEGRIALAFDLDQFAFKINVGDKLVLADTAPKIDQEFLPGLRFIFEGVLAPGGLMRYLEVHLAGGNFQIRPVPGARIRIEANTISAEPLVFRVDHFVVNGNGIDLDAVIEADKPVRLNGVGTKFRFSEGKLALRQGRVQDFTLKGEGSLPPDLVGDAEVSAWISMGERAGNFKVLNSGAELKLNKPLKCEGTKFKTSLSGLGLRFAGEPKAHFYFTLTGSAEFDPGAIPDSNALAFLPGIKLDLLNCPLTSDWSVLKKHVKFTVTLPTVKKFKFLGCFEFELRGIGFLPAADAFGGDPAIALVGQIKFALAGGDIIDARFDFHEMLLGLPKGNNPFPRIKASGLALSVAFGSAFKIGGSLDYFDGEAFDDSGIEAKGFAGTGTLLINGLPELGANFAFLRVRRPESEEWVRAWFVYLEARKFSLQMAALPLYLREVGLGFGYRFTLTSIKKADLIDDIRALLSELKVLSRSQGNLSDRRAWTIDLEKPGESPRWTVVLRAMFSFASAAGSPTEWNATKEKALPNLALFDVVMALRSDLTFLMTMRGWLFTNYHAYVEKVKPGLQENPLVSGFMLLSPRKRMFLAHMSSNENAVFGGNPELWDILEAAIKSTRFSATFLAKPGLVHMELGWPNNLRYGYKMGGILQVEISAGLLQRVETRRYISGLSLMARGRLDLEAGLSMGFFGVRVVARADVAFGARLITVIGLRNPIKDSALYMGIGLSIDAEFGVEAWLRIKIGFCKITLRFGFTFRLVFTALVEIGMDGIDLPGLRAKGTLGLKVLGRTLRIGVDVGFRKNELQRARDLTAEIMNLGLEANDGIPELPGMTGPKTFRDGAPGFHEAAPGARQAFPAEPIPADITGPDYTVLHAEWSGTDGGGTRLRYVYFMLVPRGERPRNGAPGEWEEEPAFLPPPPPVSFTTDEHGAHHEQDVDRPHVDFLIRHLNGDCTYPIEQFSREGGNYGWRSRDNRQFPTSVDWDATISEPGGVYNVQAGQEATPRQDAQPQPLSLKRYVTGAFISEFTAADGTGHTSFDEDAFETEGISLIRAAHQPALPQLEPGASLRDSRIENPADNAYEAALLASVQQLRRSPHFRHDPNSEYDQFLRQAFGGDSSTYHVTDPGATPQEPPPWVRRHENALHTRGVMLQQMISQFRDYAAKDFTAKQALEAEAATRPLLPFAFGLVFRVVLPENGEINLGWLDNPTPDPAAPDTDAPRIRQRLGPAAENPDSDEKIVRAFASRSLGFKKIAPIFRNARVFADAASIGVSWQLDWDLSKFAAQDQLSDAQRDIEHHLAYYEVTRITLQGREAPRKFRIKAADSLAPHRLETAVVVNRRLAPRYQFTDYFHGQDQAGTGADKLPLSGITYYYTIVPVDQFGQAGPARTVEATRFPEVLPQALSEAEFSICYEFVRPNHSLDLTLYDPQYAVNPDNDLAESRKLLAVQAIEVLFPRPDDFTDGGYRLVFRKEATLALGSYGLDGGTRDHATVRNPSLNTSRAPTDVIVPLVTLDPNPPPNRSGRWVRYTVTPEELEQARIKHATDWQPEAWSVFVQAVAYETAADGRLTLTVRAESSLTPARLALRFSNQGDTLAEDDPLRKVRRPALLEWLPRNFISELHPERDLQKQVEFAHVPMPVSGTYDVNPTDSPLLAGIGFLRHPKHPRMLRMRWNPAHHDKPGYPAALNAGFTLHELDLDSISSRLLKKAKPGTGGNYPDLEEYRNQIWAKTRHLSEIQLVPADEAALVPHSTLATNEWEAWYPSSVTRAKEQPDGKEHAWWSWRESYLIWPEWSSGATEEDPLEPDALTPEGQPRIRPAFNLRPHPAQLAFATTALPVFIDTAITPGAILSLQFIPGETDDPNSRILLYNPQVHPGTTASAIYDPQSKGLGITFSDVVGEITARRVILEAVRYLLFAMRPPQQESFRVKLRLELPLEPPLGQGFNNQEAEIALITTDQVPVIERYAGQHSAEKPPRAADTLHPFLGAVVRAMETENRKQLYNCEIQGLPEARTEKWEDFLADSPPGTDEYGWGLLQRLGLSLTFTLRHFSTGEPVSQKQAEERLRTAIQRTLDSQPGWALLRAHLHVEFLIQRGFATGVRLENKFNTRGLLAAMQLSLRPLPRRLLHYQRAIITAPPGQELTLFVRFHSLDDRCEMIEATAPGAAAVTLLNTNRRANPGTLVRVRTDSAGRCHLLFRGLRQEEVADVRVVIPEAGITRHFLGALSARFIETHQDETGAIWTSWDDGIFIGLQAPENRKQIRAALTKRHLSIGHGAELPGGNQIAFRFRYSGAGVPAEPLRITCNVSLTYDAGPVVTGSPPVKFISDPNDPARFGVLVLDRFVSGKELTSATVNVTAPADNLWAPLDGHASRTWTRGAPPQDTTPALPREPEPFLYIARSHPTVVLERVAHPGQASTPAEGLPAPDDAPYDVYRTFGDWPAFFGTATCIPEPRQPDDGDGDEDEDEEAPETEDRNSPQAQWHLFKALVESLRPVDPSTPAKQLLPLDTASIDTLAANFLAWTVRFHEHRGCNSGADGTEGPWQATAYPRSGAPAFAVPEDDGRLRYDHFLEDRWAHARRYYLWPFSRYDRFWHGLVEGHPAAELLTRLNGSRLPAVRRLSSAAIAFRPQDFIKRHVDASIARIEEVEAPLILASRRLDEIVPGDQALTPGKTWEVILARHPEQALADHNSTLRRRLSFRRVQWALLRRPIYLKWKSHAETQWLPPGTSVVFPAHRPDTLPQYPATALGPISKTPLEVERDNLLELALPPRGLKFHDGAMVVQWDAQPYCYAHRFIACAISGQIASPLTEILQKDFQFISPGGLTAFLAADNRPPDSPADPATLRQDDLTELLVLSFELASFWDCLPQDVRTQWPCEDPANATGNERFYTSLPDPDVGYEFLLTQGGDVARQDELHFKIASNDGSPPRNPLNNEPMNWIPAIEGKGRRILLEGRPLVSLPPAAAPATRLQMSCLASPLRSILPPQAKDETAIIHMKGSEGPVALHQRIYKSCWELSNLGREADITLASIRAGKDPVSRGHPCTLVAAELPPDMLLETGHLMIVRKGRLGTLHGGYLATLQAAAPGYQELADMLDRIRNGPEDDYQRESVLWMPLLPATADPDGSGFFPQAATFGWDPHGRIEFKAGAYLQGLPAGLPFRVAAERLLPLRDEFPEAAMAASAAELNAHFGLTDATDHFVARTGGGVIFIYSARHAPGPDLPTLRASSAGHADEARLAALWNQVEHHLTNVVPGRAEALPVPPVNRRVNDVLIVGTRLLREGSPAVVAEIANYYQGLPFEPMDLRAVPRLAAHQDFQNRMQRAFGAVEIFEQDPTDFLGEDDWTSNERHWKYRLKVEQLEDEEENPAPVFRWLGAKPGRNDIEAIIAANPGNPQVERAALALNRAPWPDNTEPNSFEQRLPTGTALQIPAGLENRLQLCQWQIRYTGILGSAHAQELADFFGSAADKEAVKRMKLATLHRALDGWKPLLRTRRGGATPGTIKVKVAPDPI